MAKAQKEMSFLGHLEELRWHLVRSASAIFIIAIVLFVFLKNRNLFQFNSIFFIRFLKIIFASIIMGIFFKYLIITFESNLIYNFNFKSFYLILSVLFCLIIYLLVSFFIKAFNSKDLQLKY